MPVKKPNAFEEIEAGIKLALDKMATKADEVVHEVSDKVRTVLAEDRAVWYPIEKKLVENSQRRRHRRTPQALSDFRQPRREINRRLCAVGTDPITDLELVCSRLYTGPMFEKYSAVLRGVPRLVPFLTRRFETLCKGNRYGTTIHSINAALIKLSRISRAEKVYRGVGGMALPDRFLAPDEHGVRGGVEFGFLSATTDRAVAMQYAASSASGIVYEIQQAMGDRGADLSWLSMYPYEAEVCFPPVLGLEVMTNADGLPAKRVEGSVVVIELRPSVAVAFSSPHHHGPATGAGGLMWELLPRPPAALRALCCPCLPPPMEPLPVPELDEISLDGAADTAGAPAPSASFSPTSRWRSITTRRLKGATRFARSGTSSISAKSRTGSVRIPAASVSVISHQGSHSDLATAHIIDVRDDVESRSLSEIEDSADAGEVPSGRVSLNEHEETQWWAEMSAAYQRRSTDGGGGAQ